jgi:hypothetical protein
VLLLSSADLSQEDIASVAGMIEKRHGPTKIISVRGNPRALIVKTSELVAPMLRGEELNLEVEGKRLVSVLTSGAIGNLKRRATGAEANGKVP